MKILCIKDHVRSSINDFHERNRAITNPEDDEQSAFLRFSENHCSSVFY